MKSIRITLITAGLLATFSGLSTAQNVSPAESPRAAHMQKMHAQRMDQHAKHLAELKSKLNLNSSQENAWQTFEQSMQMSNHTPRSDHAVFEKMTTPERIDQMQTMRTQRAALMQKHGEATKTFYAQLNAEQKKEFDAQSMTAMKNMRGMGSGMQHKQHGHHGQH